MEQEPQYRLLSADQSWVRWLLAWLVPRDRFWMTYRLPFQKMATITFPRRTGILSMSAKGIIAHERHHVRQFAPWWGPWWVLLRATLVPLPVLFSGRWFLERHAYLDDIQRGRNTVDKVVDLLWSSYGWCWPKPLMRRWFRSRIKETTPW
jgi:hypothetical protein